MINRILYLWPFHMKFMKLAEGSRKVLDGPIQSNTKACLVGICLFLINVDVTMLGGDVNVYTNKINCQIWNHFPALMNEKFIYPIY